MILIILAIVVGAPIVLPVIGGILGLVLGILATVFGVFIALVLVFVVLAVTGAALVWAGIVSLVPEIAVGLALIGTGLILGVIGVIGTVACVKLCMVVFRVMSAAKTPRNGVAEKRIPFPVHHSPRRWYSIVRYTATARFARSGR